MESFVVVRDCGGETAKEYEGTFPPPLPHPSSSPETTTEAVIAASRETTVIFGPATVSRRRAFGIRGLSLEADSYWIIAGCEYVVACQLDSRSARADLQQGIDCLLDS